VCFANELGLHGHNAATLQIEEQLRPFAQTVARLDVIPEVDQRVRVCDGRDRGGDGRRYAPVSLGSTSDKLDRHLSGPL